MSSGLKSRVKRLENVGTVKEIGGIIVYFDNPIREEIDGISQMVSADYYLKNDNDDEPLTDEELEKALEDKMLITYLPIEDKAEDIEYHIIEKNA